MTLTNSAILLTLALWAERLIFLLLVLLSVYSVAIMIERQKRLKPAQSRASLEDIKRLLSKGELEEVRSWAGSQDGSSLVPAVIRCALESSTGKGALHVDAIDRAVRARIMEERRELERGLSVLATLGSNAPFIGLLGTVLGIMQAFGELANQTGGTSSVIRGVSGALVATAVGLFVAIPAVVAYNAFSGRVRSILMDAEAARDLFIARFVRE